MRRHFLFETCAGFAAIGWGASGISCFRLPAAGRGAAEHSLLARFPSSTAAEPPGEIAAVVDAACRYFMGERIDFSTAPVDLGAQVPFFARVYDFVRRLGWGETTTYGAVARALGEGPEAARAVGEAMARNPVPLIVPCHRVTAAGGRIGGFSAPGGATSKARMLALEGAAPAAPSASPQMGFGF
ncbi:methylated-DNA--[protein]-cysteine S-methyltransferase [Sphingomonas quercus]|uniref:Methylated-DNA--[protein]-cysteine S-methyltransferase n=1 Tax=Sphingomonas quercus TaxID=2842451 RepID=A0ABS6BGT1_9SPHN|nr:methylated-DNA--[protein]-cysteine S-methyltransferase [Sphingomonas quercus]MBU3077503.1 methylated-DNA--[protein]-cysteine S-methyltransferase [Sphingomonas quercus]